MKPRLAVGVFQLLGAVMLTAAAVEGAAPAARPEDGVALAPPAAPAATDASASLTHTAEPDPTDSSPASASTEHRAEAKTPVSPAAPVAGAPPAAAVPAVPEPTVPSLEREQLRALMAGQLGADVDLRALFAVSLTDAQAVRNRATALGDMVRDSEVALREIETRLADAKKRAPQVAPPPLLAEAPTPPPPFQLEPPAAPAKPTALDKKGRLKRKERQQLAAYREALAAYELAKAEYDKAQAAHAAALAEHQNRQSAYEAAQAQYQAELARRRIEQGAQVDELERRQRETRQRLDLLQLRHDFLSHLSQAHERMGQAAQRAFASLEQPRAALRSYSSRVGALAAALQQLATRTRAVEARAEAGALVGFLVDRDRFKQQAEAALQQLDLAVEEVRLLAQDLDALALDQEREGLAAQQTVLHYAAIGLPADAVDEVFRAHFRESRRLRKVVAERPLQQSLAATEALAAQVQQTLAQPEAVGTIADAERSLAAVTERRVEAMTLVDARSADLARWRLAQERQLIAALDPLISERARSEAYAFSAAYFFDLQDEAAVLLGRLQGWALRRGRAVLEVVTFEQPAVTWLWLGRLLTLAALVVVLRPLRRRIPSLVTWLVRRAIRWGPLQGRYGTLVRWAGLLQVVMPTALLLLLGYLGLAVLGWQRAEIQLAEVIFRWLMIYLLGRDFMIGLTRRVSRGRPALIGVSEQTLELLQVTYYRLGLVLVLTAAAAEVTEAWLASGRLTTLIEVVLLFGLLGWFLWACFGWRATLAAAWQQHGEQPEWMRKLAQRMAGDRRLAVLSPLVFVGLAGHWLFVRGHQLFVKGGLSTYFRARELKRLARKTDAAIAVQLDPSYLDDFPLYPIIGDAHGAVLPRDELTGKLLEQLQRWRETRGQGSVAIMGEKGIGKTTLLGMFMSKVEDLPAVYHTLQSKRLSDADLVSELAPLLGASGARDCDELATALNAGPERLVLLDDAHNTFMRAVNGFRGFDALVRLVNATAERVFWVVVFNRFAWQFINQSRKREHYFRRLLELPRWSASELQELIGLRNRRSGFTVRFDELLLDDDSGGGGQFQLIEGADGFFRLLWQTSRGNPRVATHLWLSALQPVDAKTMRVGLFRNPETEALGKLGDDLLFALAAVCQHENLTAEELREALNVSADFAGFALRILSEYGYLEAKPHDAARATLSPRYYQHVLDVLRSKHLLFDA